jgi:hypothetical protein
MAKSARSTTLSPGVPGPSQTSLTLAISKPVHPDIAMTAMTSTRSPVGRSLAAGKA